MINASILPGFPRIITNTMKKTILGNFVPHKHDGKALKSLGGGSLEVALTADAINATKGFLMDR